MCPFSELHVCLFQVLLSIDDIRELGVCHHLILKKIPLSCWSGGQLTTSIINISPNDHHPDLIFVTDITDYMCGKILSCEEISDFCKEFEQFMPFLF